MLLSVQTIILNGLLLWIHVSCQIKMKGVVLFFYSLV